MDQTFAQYGAVGLIAGLALLGVKVLFNRLEAALTRERERSDRLETELRELNRTIHGNYAVVLNDATKAVAEALAYVRQSKHR